MLSSNGTTETISWFLNWVKEASPAVWPTVIMTDRDQAQMNAIKRVYPDSRTLLCLWHVVTALAPIAIPKQPEDNWFDALADTPAVASPLETLAWLHAPDSPSLGKRTFHSETGLNTPRYGPAEYEAITSPTGPTRKRLIGPRCPGKRSSRRHPPTRPRPRKRPPSRPSKAPAPSR